MKKTILILTIIVSAFVSQAQGIYNTGARIVSESGSYWVLANGEFTLISESSVNIASMANLKIEADASLTLTPTSFMTVNGTLINASGIDGLIIQSDASSTGSLLQSSASVNATMQRYLSDADWDDPYDGWHFLSSPVASQAISPAFTTVPDTDYDFFTWYEPSNLWVNYKNTSTSPTWNTAHSNSDNFLVGKGYMVEYNTPATKEFSGVLNITDVNVSGLTITGSIGVNRSWHLLGNPFSCALNWDASVDWNLLNIAGVAKIWNEEYQGYSDLSSSPSSLIPSTNGFMVQVSSGTGNLTIPVSKREHSSQPFFKSSISSIRLIARNTSLGNAQESNIILNQEATPSFDLMFDSEFLPGYGPGFYSLAGDEKLSTNSLPTISTETTIPFVFIPNAGNNYTLEASGLEFLNSDAMLLDRKTNTDINLSQHPNYTFSSSADDTPERFLLHFSPTGLNDPPKDVISAISYFDHQLNLYNCSENTMLDVFDLQGRILLQAEFTGKGMHSLPFNEPTGIYLIRLITNHKVSSTKIAVH